MQARKFTLTLTLAMMFIVSMVGTAHADNLNFAPALCDLGAPGLVSQGMSARTTLKVEPDAVVAQFGEAQAILDALIAQQIETDLLGFPHAVHQDAALQPILVPDVASSEEIEITGNASCVSYFEGNMIVRYVPVVADGTNGYMIETVLWNSASIQSDGDGDNPLNFQVENFSLRLLTPIYTPVVPNTNGQILAPDDIIGADYCAGAPKSYLQVGMDAQMYITGHMQNYLYENGFPSGLGAEQPLNQYGMEIANLVDDGGLLTNPNVDLYFMDDYMFYESDFVKFVWGMFPPEVEIIDGPECGAWNLNNSGGEQFNYPEVILTYWKIRVDINGATYEGWFPENASSDIWWDDNPNFWTTLITTYHLHPISENGNGANNCPAPQQQSGSRVEPSAGAMNIRVEPAGDVIGRLEIREHILLFGEPICEGGSNWWQTDRGGYIAENDPTTGTQLLTPYIPDPTPVPSDPSDTTSSSQPSEPAPRPTQQPSSSSSGGGETGGCETTAAGCGGNTGTSGECDPATGEGCPGTGSGGTGSTGETGGTAGTERCDPATGAGC